jgi:OOP family OmpA-OmpF porin
MQLFNETRKKVRLEGVNFELESDRLTSESHHILDRVANALHDRPDLKVEVAGHTDNTGTPDYNKDLSQRRAEAVRNYLISKGIDGSRLTARGYGETEPEVSNDTEAGRAQNRRVELKQIGE